MINRVTTTGVLKSYQSGLQHASQTLNAARNTVLTQRYFNSFAEDPAAATQAFQLRRSFLRTNSQITISNSLTSKFQAGWSALGSVKEMVNTGETSNALKDALQAIDDAASGAGRNALGTDLEQLAQSIVQTMNAKYGENYIFAGADGLNVPFELKDGTLYYRGVDVNSTNQADLDKLQYLSQETNYLDIGLGMQADNDGNLIESSAYNESLPGINYLGGYGKDGEGDPKNIVSIITEMADILKRCSADGDWASTADKEDFLRLAGKFEAAADEVSIKYTELDSQARFVRNNHEQLESTAYTLNEQILGLEQVDLADAISSYSWAQYCYNAALKMGNSILGQSLMDYISS